MHIIRSRYTVPTIGLAVFAVLIGLYLAHSPLYLAIMHAMIRVPASRPFSDWEWLPSAVRCWAEGVDVYVNNTCYRLGKGFTFNYSPLWLRLVFLRTGEAWTGQAMLTAGTLFFLSLITLPGPRTPRDQAISLLATLSCSTFLVIERGNADLVLFLLIVAAVHLRALALPFRLVGYALIVLCGLLKFYPMAAMIIVARERFAVFAAVALASVAALAALVLAYHDELRAMAGNLPPPSYFLLQFGWGELPGGLGAAVAAVLGTMMHADAETARAAGMRVAGALQILLIAPCCAAAVSVARRYDLRSALRRLSARQADFLAVGAALMCGCFFAGQNVIYRGIFFLLVLPGLAALSRAVPAGGRVFRWTAGAILLVLWTPFLNAALLAARLATPLQYPADGFRVFPGFDPGYALWLVSELAWWGVIAVFLAVLGTFLLDALAIMVGRPGRTRIRAAR